MDLLELSIASWGYGNEYEVASEHFELESLDQHTMQMECQRASASTLGIIGELLWRKLGSRHSSRIYGNFLSQFESVVIYYED